MECKLARNHGRLIPLQLQSLLQTVLIESRERERVRREREMERSNESSFFIAFIFFLSRFKTLGTVDYEELITKFFVIFSITIFIIIFFLLRFKTLGTIDDEELITNLKTVLYQIANNCIESPTYPLADGNKYDYPFMVQKRMRVRVRG